MLDIKFIRENVEFVTGHFIQHFQDVLLGKEMPGNIQMHTPIGKTRTIHDPDTRDPRIGSQLLQRTPSVEEPGFGSCHQPDRRTVHRQFIPLQPQLLHPLRIQTSRHQTVHADCRILRDKETRENLHLRRTRNQLHVGSLRGTGDRYKAANRKKQPLHRDKTPRKQ